MAKTALISGGTSGMGKAIALRLLEGGFNIVTFSPDKEGISKLKDELGAKYEDGQFMILEGDVTDESAMRSLVGGAIKRFGNIDILINNAGLPYYALAEDLDIKRARKVLDVNIMGVVILSKLLIPHMKQRHSGLIINTVSVAGKRPGINRSLYTASKYGAFGFSQSMRLDLKGTGVRVATVNPGVVDTPFWSEKELERRKELHGGTLPPMLRPEDVAEAVYFICTRSDTIEISDLDIRAVE